MLTQDGILRADGSIIDNNGAPNLIKNGHAEINATGWIVSKNTVAASRPDSGFVTSSTNITWTRNTTNPIDGQADFLYTKDAANRQGEQVYYGFTVAKKYRAKVLQIEVDYLVNSGTFSAGSSSTDSDVILYIYDVTNSTFIEPSSFKFLSSSSTIADKFVANFQTSATGSSYRILFHQATTSSSAFAVQFKEVRVSPCQYVYGTPITDWQSYTYTGFTSTNGVVSSKWRRVGDTMEIIQNVEWSGAAGAFSGRFGLPSGYSIDTNKLALNTLAVDRTLLGRASFLDSGLFIYDGFVTYDDTTTVNVWQLDASVSTGRNATITATSPFSFGTNDTINLKYSVPITGWSSSTQVSDGYDGRLIGARAYLDGGTTVTSGSAFIFSTKSHDKTNSYDTSNGRFTAPSSGIYKISALITYASSAWTAGNTNNLQLYKNGSFHSFLDANDIQASVTAVIAVRGSAQIELNAGDYLTIVPSFIGSRSSISNAGLNWASFEKLASPQTVSATEVVSAFYQSTAGQSFNATEAISNFGTKVHDTHNAVSNASSSFTFTAPVAGYYEANARHTTGAVQTNADMYSTFFFNGVAVGRDMHYVQSNNSIVCVRPYGYGWLNAGETIQLKTRAGSPASVSTSNVENFITIKRVK